MAKRKSNDGWWLALIAAVGVGLLYYFQTGQGEENDSALIPNTLEGKMDALIAALNKRFGKHWIDSGLGVIKYYVQNALPAPLVTLVDVVATVENMSRRGAMTSYDKKQLAVRMAQGR